jgi:hypothetical protein
LAGFNEAIEVLASQVAEAERVLGEEQKRIEHAAAGEKLAREIDVIEAKLTPWLAATRELAAAMEALGTLRFEAGAIGRYCANAAGEVEIAATVVVADLRHAVTAIREGREPIPQPPPSAAPVIVTPSKPETKTVFLMRNAKFHDAAGKLQLLRKFRDAELPLAFAVKAIASGAAVELGDPRRKELLNSASGHAEEAWCESLDDGDTNREPIKHSAFTIVDRGPVRSYRLSPREPEAARSADDLEYR